jgi:hypothetical protein
MTLKRRDGKERHRGYGESHSFQKCSPDQHLMKLLDRLCLFIVNTVFAMQFNSPLLISQDDLLVACS